MRQPEIAEEVGSKRLDQLLRIDLLRAAGRVLLGRVIDQNVQAAELIDAGIHRPLAEVGVADISAQLQPTLTLRLHQCDGVIGIGLFVQIDNRHRRTLGGEMHRSRAANSGISTRDQSHLAFEFAGCGIAVTHADRFRLHRRLMAGLARLTLCRTLFLQFLKMLGHDPPLMARPNCTNQLRLFHAAAARDIQVCGAVT